jgi:hypothetical protein
MRKLTEAIDEACHVGDTLILSVSMQHKQAKQGARPKRLEGQRNGTFHLGITLRVPSAPHRRSPGTFAKNLVEFIWISSFFSCDH